MSQEPLRILVIGAGVIGSVYAAHLQAAGNNVTLLARGQPNKRFPSFSFKFTINN
jgi:ketopantoate reductase